MPKASLLLNLLRERMGQYISGEELSENLSVTRTAVWKHIHLLEESGYGIEAVPHLGYRLISVPDQLLPDEIKAGLKTRCFGQKVYGYKQTTSTNDRALELAAAGAAEGTLITTEMQTHGRGRRERVWHAKANTNLLFTLILRPAWSLDQAPLVTLLMAVALAKSIRHETGLAAQIKWPNDILVGENKVAGILTEMRVQANEIAYVAVGLGVNVNHHPTGNLRHPATSLAKCLGQPVLRLPLLRRILLEAEKLYFRALKEGFAMALQEWDGFSVMNGSHVVMELADGSPLEGMVMGVDDFGGLLIRQENGITQRITTGECVKIRKSK
jgi:BirA family biotin operon repressor/biotin-[acetyl-CoA-carboxylase] ligase